MAIAACLALSACQSGPQLVAFKPGTTFDDRQQAYDACKIAAINQIPAEIRTDYNPGLYNPGTLQCSAIGTYVSCQRFGEINIPPTVSQYDANDSLRSRAINRCMENKGYQFLDKAPRCTSEAQKRAALTQPQPDTAEKICNPGLSLDR